MAIKIGSTTYQSYVTLAQANAYLAAEASMTAWRAASTTDDDKARAIVTATRVLDRQNWIGSKTESDQALAWPRTSTGLSDVTDEDIPQAILDACCVLAGLVIAGVDITGKSNTEADKVKRQSAGSVSIEYFRNLDDGTRFPTAAWELIAPYVGAGSSGAGGVLAFGTDSCSDFGTDYRPASAF